MKQNFKFSINLSRATLSLILLTILSGILLIVRMLETKATTGTFLIWNLFLAWMPLFFALVGRRASSESSNLKTKQKYWIAINLFFWLLFFPNSTYIITDLMHLNHLGGRLLWYDSVGIFIAALTGLAVGLYSLFVAHEVLDKIFNKYISWVIVSFSVLLSGFGIFLGRFIRLNSWDLFTDPFYLARTCFQQIQNPLALKTTAVFGFVTMVLYLAFVILLPAKNSDEYSKNVA